MTTIEESLDANRAWADKAFAADHNPSLDEVVELLRQHRAYEKVLRGLLNDRHLSGCTPCVRQYVRSELSLGSGRRSSAL